MAFVAALALAVTAASRAPDTVQGDEKGFLYYGTMQAELYSGCVKGDVEACSDWRWSEPYQAYGSNNPKVGLYVLGALDHATRGLERDRRVPTMRLLMGLLAALAVGGLAWLGSSGGGGRWTGLLAAGWLLAHPVYRSVHVALLPDVPMLLLAVLALGAFSVALRGGGMRRAVGLVAAGALAGLAAACKLYAASLFPVMLVILALWRRTVGLRGGLAAALGWLVGAAVFVGSNPYLWQQPGAALRAMTTGHVQALGGQALGLEGLESLAWLLWVPVSLFEPSMDARTQLLDLQPGLGAMFGGVLFALGLAIAITRRRWLPVVWALVVFLVCGYVVSRFEPSWLYPRAFLLPALAVAWICAQLDGRAIAGMARRLGARRFARRIGG